MSEGIMAAVHRIAERIRGLHRLTGQLREAQRRLIRARQRRVASRYRAGEKVEYIASTERMTPAEVCRIARKWGVGRRTRKLKAAA